jgi:hypothetical protein
MERILQHVWKGQRQRGLGGDTVVYKENGQVSNASLCEIVLVRNTVIYK